MIDIRIFFQFVIRDKLIELKKWGVNTTVEKISREEITAIKDGGGEWHEYSSPRHSKFFLLKRSTGSSIHNCRAVLSTALLEVHLSTNQFLPIEG